MFLGRILDFVDSEIVMRNGRDTCWKHAPSTQNGLLQQIKNSLFVHLNVC